MASPPLISHKVQVNLPSCQHQTIHSARKHIPPKCRPYHQTTSAKPPKRTTVPQTSPLHNRNPSAKHPRGFIRKLMWHHYNVYQPHSFPTAPFPVSPVPLPQCLSHRSHNLKLSLAPKVATAYDHNCRPSYVSAAAARTTAAIVVAAITDRRIWHQGGRGA